MANLICDQLDNHPGKTHPGIADFTGWAAEKVTKTPFKTIKVDQPDQ